MKHILIIGNSAAGVSAAEELRKKNGEAKITVVSDESYAGYHRCLISYYLAGDIKEEKLIYRGKEFYSENNITLLLNKKVSRVEPKKNQLVLEDKTRLDYDVLLLACGASAKIPELKGIHKKSVFGFRTMDDAKQILGLLPVTRAVSVLGGGLIGLKAAYALKKRNLEVKVIVKSAQLLSQVLDQESAAMFMKRFESQGIDVITGNDVEEIIGNGDVKAVKLSSGKAIASSIVVVAKGVVPNTEIVKEAGINVDEGILVDEYMKTNIENIFAAGDIAQAFDPLLEKPVVNALWPNAVEQGKVSAASIAGEKIKYPGSLGMNSVEFFGLPVISFGITRPPKDKAYREIIYRDAARDIYKKIVLLGKVIKGAIFVNRIENIGILLKLARLKADISGIEDKLLRPDFNFAATRDLDYDKEEIYI